MASNTIQGSLDTNVLLRFVLDDVLDHNKKIDSLLSQGSFFEVADAAVFEMVYVLERKLLFSRDYVCQKVFGVTRNDQFICNRKLFERVLPVYLEKPKLSIIDCALVEYARLNKAIPLYTFDKELSKQEGAATFE